MYWQALAVITLLTMDRETMKRVLAFPPETKVEWKSHDSSIAQRTAIDDARKEKNSEKRNGAAKDEDRTERKQAQ